MIKFTYRLIGIIFIISFLGCSQRENEDGTNHLRESQQSSESSDYGMADETSAESASMPDIQFIQETTYGSTDDVLVGMIGPVVVDMKGRVFITDRNQITVHVFQPDGSFYTSLGSQGRGPGEFMGVTPNTSIAIHSNRLYITDQADTHFQFPYRMHEFLLEDLSFSRTMNLLAVNKAELDELDGKYPAGYYSKQVFPLKNGTFLVSYHRSPNEYQDKESNIYYVIQDSNGEIIDGPVLKQKDRTNLTAEVTDTAIPYTAISSFPFFGKSLLIVSEDDFLYAVNHSEEFKIDIYTPQGEHVRNIEHDFENKIFNKDEVVDYYEKTNYRHELGEGVALKMIREAENLPETWPAIEVMLIDDDNRLWVSTIVEDFDIYEWWVLDGDSGYVITKFEWPQDEPIEVIRNGYMYTRQTDDETDLQQVVRYRIEFEEV